MLTLFSTSLALGFVHGLGADHLMAIAALAVAGDGGGHARSFGVAVRFAIGHALLLAVGTAAVVVLGWNIPLLVERTGEMAGGAILIALGAAGLWIAFTRRVYAHSHAHVHGSDDTHAHWHLHFGRPDRHPRPFGHSHLPGLIGAAFAVSGLRALMLMIPLGAHAFSVLLPLIAVFAVGILASMTLFGVLLSRVLGASGVGRFGRAAGAATSLASIALGAYWMVG